MEAEVTGKTNAGTTEELLGRLKISYQTAMASGDFMGDERAIKKAIEALKVPDPEARVKAQLRINAEKTLSHRAMVEFKKTGKYELPTPEAIEAYIADGLEKYRQKQEQM